MRLVIILSILLVFNISLYAKSNEPVCAKKQDGDMPIFETECSYPKIKTVNEAYEYYINTKVNQNQSFSILKDMKAPKKNDIIKFENDELIVEVKNNDDKEILINIDVNGLQWIKGRIYIEQNKVKSDIKEGYYGT